MGDVNLEIKLNNLKENVTNTNKNVDEVSSVISDNRDWLKSKNLFQIQKPKAVLNGITFEPLSDGSIKVTGTLTTATTAQYQCIPNKTQITQIGMKAGKTYILSKGKSTILAYPIIWFWDSSGTYINGVSCKDKEYIIFTIPDNCELISFVLEVANTDFGKTVSDIVYPMIRLSSVEDDTFEPYIKSNVELASDLATLIETLKSKGVID